MIKMLEAAPTVAYKVTVQLKPGSHRSMPDPLVNTIRHHRVLCNVRDLPKNLPTFDPRNPDITKRMYKEIAESFLSDEPFHLKNRGITLFAESVKVYDESIIVDFGSSRAWTGIVDGLHTYILIMENLKGLKNSQYVWLNFIVEIPKSLAASVAEGLNTSTQVSRMSIANFKGEFDAVKEVLKSEKYFESIAWSENDEGTYDAKEILSFLNLFRPKYLKNDEQPTGCNRKIVVENYLSQKGEFLKALPLLKDVLYMRDYMESRLPVIYNGDDGKAGLLFFVTKKKNELTFLGGRSDYKLTTVLYPLVASLRPFVNTRGSAYSFQGGRSALKEYVDSRGVELINKIRSFAQDIGTYNPHDMGRYASLYGTLFHVAKDHADR